MKHKNKASCFYQRLRNPKPNESMFTLDCEKTQPVPKLPIGAAYFKRQLGMNNFTVVSGHSKSTLDKTNVLSFTWHEGQAKKGVNEIASSLYHSFKRFTFDQNHSEVVVAMDNTVSTNKSQGMLVMTMYWLHNHAPKHIKQVELLFPVVGHSFLPPDRVFGMNEKAIRKKEVIFTPSEYVNIFKEHATVIELSEEASVLNWMKEARNNLKPTASYHFRLTKCCKIIIRRNRKHGVTVRGEEEYDGANGKTKSLFKKNKSITQLAPTIVTHSILIDEDKLKDIRYLFNQYFDQDWINMDEMKFWTNLLQGKI